MIIDELKSVVYDTLLAATLEQGQVSIGVCQTE